MAGVVTAKIQWQQTRFWPEKWRRWHDGHKTYVVQHQRAKFRMCLTYDGEDKLEQLILTKVKFEAYGGGNNWHAFAFDKESFEDIEPGQSVEAALGTFAPILPGPWDLDVTAKTQPSKGVSFTYIEAGGLLGETGRVSKSFASMYVEPKFDAQQSRITWLLIGLGVVSATAAVFAILGFFGFGGLR